MSEAKAQEREAGLAEQLELLCATVERLNIGGDAAPHRRQQASSSATTSSTDPQQRSRYSGAYCPLATPRAATQGKMQGAEASWRSRFIPLATPEEVTAPRSHPDVTAKSSTCSEASAYTKALQDHCCDKKGTKVESIHKGAKASRPLRAIRRGEALAPVYTELARTRCSPAKAGLDDVETSGADEHDVGSPRSGTPNVLELQIA